MKITGPLLHCSLQHSTQLLEVTSVHEIVFHGRAASHRPNITIQSAKCRLKCSLEGRITFYYLAACWMNLGWLAQSPDLNPIEHLLDNNCDDCELDLLVSFTSEIIFCMNGQKFL